MRRSTLALGLVLMVLGASASGVMVRDVTGRGDPNVTNGRREMPSYRIPGVPEVHETTALRVNPQKEVNVTMIEGAFWVDVPELLTDPNVKVGEGGCVAVLPLRDPRDPNAPVPVLPFNRAKLICAWHAEKDQVGKSPFVGDVNAPKVTEAYAVPTGGKTLNGFPIYRLQLKAETTKETTSGLLSVIFETAGARAGWVESSKHDVNDVWATSEEPNVAFEYADCPALYRTATAAVDVVGYSLIHYWPLDEGQGNIARDVVGTADGALGGWDFRPANMPFWTTGRMGGALLFTASVAPFQSVSLSKGREVNPDHFTLSVWAKPQNMPGQGALLLHKGGLREKKDYVFKLDKDGYLVLGFGNDTPGVMEYFTVTSSVSVPWDEWTFLSATRDGTKACVFWNGQLVGSGVYDFPTLDRGLVATIGSLGIFDDVRMYDGALPEKDINDLYQDGLNPTWVVNEIFADSTVSIADDPNAGSMPYQFVEFVNHTGMPQDISGWKVVVGTTVRHTFPAGTVVPNKTAVVLFGGGIPQRDFYGSIVQKASTNQLGLKLTGDTVSLKSGTVVMATYTYGAEGGKKQSLTRSPDVTGREPLVLHSQAPGSGGKKFSPGTCVDGSAFQK
jgi:hypothetical protein